MKCHASVEVPEHDHDPGRSGGQAIGGECGDFAGVSLIAGSDFLFGLIGVRLGAGMQRGTLAVFAGPPPLLPTFRFDCAYRPVFSDLCLRQLAAWGFPVLERYRRGLYRRCSGDLVALGKGEILHWLG